MRKNLSTIVLGSSIFAAGMAAGALLQRPAEARAQAGRVFELRTYTANEGKLDALHARFRNHTTKLFEKHGITNVGYWRPTDDPLSRNTLVYLLAYPSREAATKSWEAFRADPEWQKAKAASEVDGLLVGNVESVFMEPTDYSPVK